MSPLNPRITGPAHKHTEPPHARLSLCTRLCAAVATLHQQIDRIGLIATYAVGLLPGCPSQRVIDPILPTRPGLLEVIKNIAIDAQRDLFFGAWKRRSLRSRFCGLCCCSLKRRFGRIQWGHGSSCFVGGHSCPRASVVANERHHPLEQVAGLRQVWRVAGVSFGVDVFQRDLAASLAVKRPWPSADSDEPLRLVAPASTREGRETEALSLGQKLLKDPRRGSQGWVGTPA
jgi:hypothetical protein